MRVYSSVQNNEEASGERTQETVAEEAKALLTAKEANKKELIND